MVLARAVSQAVLAIALGLLVSSSSCTVHACSGDCCDHDHDDGDCDHHHVEAAPTGPALLLLPLPGIPAPAPVWVPLGL